MIFFCKGNAGIVVISADKDLMYGLLLDYRGLSLVDDGVTFEQVLEVRAAGTEDNFVSSESFAPGGEGHVNKVLILQKALEGVGK